MKKVLSLILMLLVLTQTGMAEFIPPYPVAQNATRYTPWFTMYHMQTAREQERGLRGGEGGQVIMSMACSQLDPNLMLFGSDTAGLWRSTDGGESWNVVYGTATWSITAIAFHPTQKNTVYFVSSHAALDQNSITKLSISEKDGLYKSTDGGKTFTQVLHKEILSTFHSEDLIRFDKYENVYVLTSEGVFKSSDEGATWENLGVVAPKSTGVFSLYVSPDGRTIAAGTQAEGIVASFNGGLLWESRNGNIEKAPASCVIANPDNENHWFSVYNGKSKGVYESFDKGATWTPVEYYTYAEKNIPEFIKFGAQKADGTRNMYLVYNIMANPFRVSTDYGKTWGGGKIIKDGLYTHQLTGYQSEGLCVHPTEPDIVYYSFSDVVFKSTDGGQSFEYSCGGFSGNYCQQFIFGDDGRIWLPFTDKGIAVTDYSYNGENYPTGKMILTGGTATDVAINPRNPRHIISCLGNWTTQTLYQSFDGGATWEQIKSAPQSGYGEIEFHKDKEIIYAVSYTSFDGGISWTKNEIGIGAVSPVNNDVVYGTKDKTIYRSENCGKSWTPIGDVSSVYVMRADKFDQNTVWVGCYDGSIRKITGANMTVFNAKNGLPDLTTDIKLSISAFSQDPRDKNHLLTGGKCTYNGENSPGLYESWDGGNTWELVPGLPGTGMIFEIDFHPQYEKVFLGTYQGTIIYDCNDYKKYKDNPLADRGDEINIDGKIHVRVNSDNLKFDSDPIIENGRTMVPMRAIFEYFDMKVEWNAEERSVTAADANNTIKLTVGSTEATVNGKSNTLDAAPLIQNGRTLVPLRFIAEALNAKVDWKDSIRTVEITK